MIVCKIYDLDIFQFDTWNFIYYLGHVLVGRSSETDKNGVILPDETHRCRSTISSCLSEGRQQVECSAGLRPAVREISSWKKES